MKIIGGTIWKKYIATCFFSFFILFSSAVCAAEITCRGEVLHGSLDSSVGDCGFYTNSAAWSKVVAVCGWNNICEVTGRRKSGVAAVMIDKVISLKLLKKAQ